MKYNKFLFLIALFLILAPFNAYSEEDSPLEILFFYSSHCKACLGVKNDFLPGLEEKYKDKITVIYLNTKERDNLSKLIALSSFYGLEDSKVPTVFCEGELMVGKEPIEEKLPLIIDSCSSKRKFMFFDSAFEKGIIEEKFKSLSVFLIISAGLLDGINPCAFAVIIFFISFLTCYGYKKRELIIIGSSYILAVFIAYLLIGLGLFSFLYSLEYFYAIMKIFYISVALLCFLLCFLSLYDFIKFLKTKEAGQSLLQLPKFVKLKIHKVIGDEFRQRPERGGKIIALFLSALGVGFAVSVLEAICTGQVYIPVITSVLKNPHLKQRSILYLVTYNLMFILPLVVVFLCALWGITSLQFSNFLKKRFGVIRLSMAILFAGLGVFLLWTL